VPLSTPGPQADRGKTAGRKWNQRDLQDSGLFLVSHLQLDVRNDDSWLEQVVTADLPLSIHNVLFPTSLSTMLEHPSAS
jgi:hypothetical protein